METLPMRQKILKQANLLFVEKGYHAISMREISSACGITKAALYYHFADKEALFLAILEEYLNAMDGLIQECSREEINLRGRLMRFVRAILAQPVEQRALIRLATQDFGQLTEQSQQVFGITYREKFIEPITGWMRTAIKEDEIPEMDPRLATWIFLGMLFPFFYPSQMRGLPGVDENFIIGIFMDGVRKK